MAVTVDEIRRFVSLAGFAPDPEEGSVSLRRLATLAAWMERLEGVADRSSVDPDSGSRGVEEISPASPPPTGEAADVPRPCLDRDLVLANFPAHRDGFLVTPSPRPPSRPPSRPSPRPSGSPGDPLD